MFASNFNAGGTVIALDTPIETVLRDFADVILGVTGSRWTEVTNADPTPAFLQAHASTVTTTGGTAYSTTSAWRHVTMYLNDWPGLNDATPSAIMLRFFTAVRGIGVCIIDTSKKDPAAYQDWMAVQSVSYASNTSYWSHHGSIVPCDTTSGLVAGTEHTYSYWMHDNMLVTRGKDANGAYVGGAVVQLPPLTIPGSLVDRTTAALAYVCPVDPSGSTNYFSVRFPALGDAALNNIGTRICELGVPSDSQDAQGREIIQRVGSYWRLANANYFGGFVDELRIARGNLSVEYATRTFEGKQFVCLDALGGYAAGINCSFWVQNEE